VHQHEMQTMNSNKVYLIENLILELAQLEV